MAKSPTKPEASTEAAYAAAASQVPVKKLAKAAVRKAPVKAAAAKSTATKPAATKPAAAAPKVAMAEVPAAPVVEVAAAPIVEAAAEPVLVAVPEPVAEIAPEPVVEAALEPAADVIAEPVVEAAPAITEVLSIAPAEAAATPSTSPIFSLKDIAMNTDFTATITETMTGAVNEVQARMQSAYDKSASVVTEMTELAKGNVEAMVESTKLVAAGVQDMGKSYADEAKAAYETATADMKEMASIKSPTELFQLQGKIMRRNFDMFIAATSKSTDAALKLANDAMAPISGRVNLTAEKLAQVAA